jgi:hypothetical protein
MDKSKKAATNKAYSSREYARTRRREREAKRREARRVYQNAWYAANKERIRKYQHEYYWVTHRDKYLQYFRDYKKARGKGEPEPNT